MSRIRPLEQFSNYLNHGCYPFYQESLNNYPQKLLEVISLTVDVDLCGIYNIDPSKLDKLKKVMYMLCSTLSKYLERMDAGSLIHLVRGGSGMRALNKPDKLLLDNPNMFNVLCAQYDIGSVRESFFVSQLKDKHQVITKIARFSQSIF